MREIVMSGIRRMLLTFCAAAVFLHVHGADTCRIAILSDLHVQDTFRLRSMDEQIHSTRLFNENYFAFRATLDDVVRRGIRQVVITGDLTDDGQRCNAEYVRDVLSDYEKRYDMNFYVLTGNHDPSRPVTLSSSDPRLKLLGYHDLLNVWKMFGFCPQASYHYWATPFSSYSYDEYSFKKAVKEQDWRSRCYHYKDSFGKVLMPAIPESSYVVEGIPGVWFLMIDASVYHPSLVKGGQVVSFENAKTGYNEAFQVKPYLLPWIKKVVEEARLKGKRLIAFSHFPAADYNQGCRDHIVEIAQPGRFDMHRFPKDERAQQLADAGITIHFAGHLHMNDDENFVSPSGNVLRSIVVPSIAGYAPGYKILSVPSVHTEALDVEMIALDSVAHFDMFFKRYQQEYDALALDSSKNIWNNHILLSKNYHEFCDWHLRELFRLRYLERDLKPIAKSFLLLDAVQLFGHVGLKPIVDQRWTGLDLMIDFYRLRYGQKAALKDIPASRIQAYRLWSRAAEQLKDDSELNHFMIHMAYLMDAYLKSVL